MDTFRVDPNTNVITKAEAEMDPAAGTAQRFASAEELAGIVAGWPLMRLVAVWNTLPGVIPVNRFTDRKTAIARIWRATARPHARRGGPHAQKPLARPASKKARVIALLGQRSGASLQQIMEATGWQAHTVRAFISRSLVRQAQLKITSSRRPDGERVYHMGRR
jgi:hypothetical protein